MDPFNSLRRVLDKAAVQACLKARRINHPTVRETPAEHELTPADEAMDVARA